MNPKRLTLALGLMVAGLLAACGAGEIPTTAPTLPETDRSTPQAAPATQVPDSAPARVPEEVTVTPGKAAGATPGEGVGEQVDAGPLVEPIEVTYFTPSQQEGPYYTVDKPADRDNDLVNFAGATGQPEGQVIVFGGRVYEATGMPVEGVVVEIWQTDSRGVYLHPGDPAFRQRDPNFQGYGEAVTAADGSYSFRTLLPGLYEPRPRHIHVKVKMADRELLTTQFYFAGEIALRGDDAAMLIDLQPGQDAEGNDILLGERDIILNTNLSSE